MNISEYTFTPSGDIWLGKGVDPAIERCRGREHFYLSADLGQSQDFTAITLIRSRTLPIWQTTTRQILAPKKNLIIWADRFKGVSYVSVIDYLCELMGKPAIAGRVTLSIDASGLGRPISDALDFAGVPHIAIQMVVGQNWTRKSKYYNVGKNLLLESLAVAFQSGELTFAEGLSLRKEIEADLASFSLTQTASGNQIITAGRQSGSHGDLSISLCIGSWVSNLKQGTFSQTKISNYY